MLLFIELSYLGLLQNYISIHTYFYLKMIIKLKLYNIFNNINKLKQ